MGRFREVKKMKIVASGYFDPIHIGHIEYLKKAKELGGKLIVIVNNDKQALLKKGFSFMNEKERMEVVKNIKYVDDVFLSIDDDKTVCKSLEKLKPDIFAKGGDRNSSNIPESQICDKYNIKIIDGLGEKIQSSSDLINGVKK
jgi:cytidyltransferase-like protein